MVDEELTRSGTATDEPGGVPEARGWSTGAKVQIVLLVLNIGFWVALLGWTLVGDHSNPPDRLDDRTFPTEAEPICAATEARIEALGLPTEVDSPLERAEMIDEENVYLTDMVSDLEALARPAGEQGEWVDTWLVDWRSHIADRQAWSDDLRAGDDHVFIETARGNEHVSNVIDNFADVNEMQSCATPGDV